MKSNSETENFGDKNSLIGKASQASVAPRCLFGVETPKDLAVQALFKSGFRDSLDKLTAISELVYFIPDFPRAGAFQVFRFSSHVVAPSRAHHFKLVFSHVCQDRYELEVLMGESLGLTGTSRSPQWVEWFKRGE